MSIYLSASRHGASVKLIKRNSWWFKNVFLFKRVIHRWGVQRLFDLDKYKHISFN